MSYAIPENAGGDAPRVRPAAVTVSSVLLLVVAALYLLSVIVSLSQLGTLTDVYRDVYGEDPDALVMANAILDSGLYVVFAVAFAVLAFTNLRGFNASRIVTWVAAGVALCCSGVGLLAQGAMSVLLESAEEADPLAAEFVRRLEEAQAGWASAVSIVAVVLSILSLIAVIILLALPASNAYFRKQPPTAEAPPYPTVQ